MTTSLLITFVLLASTCAWAAWHFTHAVRTSQHLRGVRVVTCPESSRRAAVRIDVPHAMLTALVANRPAIRMAACSLWASSTAPCHQSCRLDAQAPDRTVRSIAERWYAGRTCVFCARPIGAVHSFGHHAALLTRQGTTLEWSEVPADRLLDSLKTARPVCANCHEAETFRREHSDLVTDRQWPRDA